MSKTLPFNIEDIRKMASDRTFFRGEDYFLSGAVGKIMRTGNYFEGKVTGRRKYNVSLILRDDEPNITCSCPIGAEGGMCKHTVAFALAVAQGEYKEALAKPADKPPLSPEDFETIFTNTETNKKIAFLLQLLKKDFTLQQQFTLFVTENKSLDEISGVRIDEVRDKLAGDLTSIDYNSMVEEYDPYSGGYIDDEGYIDEVHDAIRETFREYEKQAVDLFNKGNARDAMRIICGMIEGSQGLPEPDDNYYMFPDGFNVHLREFLIEGLGRIVAEIEMVVLSADQVKEAIEILFDRYRQYENDDTEIGYNLNVLEPLLISLVKDEKTAGYLREKLTHENIPADQLPHLSLRIAEVQKDVGAWTEHAEQFAAFDKKIARQLMDKYLEKDAGEDFIRTAQAAFDKWPSHFDSYLVKNLNKDKNRDLYVKALKQHTYSTLKIRLYKELRTYLQDNEKEQFISRVFNSQHFVFYIEILEVEKRYPEILDYVQKNYSHTWNFTEIIRPIINVYPDECFTLISINCNEKMNEPKRNRNSYRTMIPWLKLMRSFTSKQSEADQFIQSLYNRQPWLPALREELRVAGLV